MRRQWVEHEELCDRVDHLSSPGPSVDPNHQAEPEVERFWFVLLLRVAMVDLQVGGMNRRPRADEACSSFAELLASIPDVGLDSDFERPVYSAEACDAVG